MAEYIDREATVGLLENKYQDMSAMPASYYAGFQYALNMLKQIPSAADVAPVVRGEWEWQEEWETDPNTHACELQSYGWYCTNCGIELGKYLTKATGQRVDLDDDFSKPNLKHCPCCGADMRGEPT